MNGRTRISALVTNAFDRARLRPEALTGALLGLAAAATLMLLRNAVVLLGPLPADVRGAVGPYPAPAGWLLLSVWVGRRLWTTFRGRYRADRARYYAASGEPSC